MKNETLIEYADLLHANGFTIYEPDTTSEYFVYSRQVDGVERFGTVQECTIRLQGYAHSMPIKPSREFGSGMFLDDVEDGYDNLTVEAATKVASARNSNSVVGGHDNFYTVPNYLTKRK